MQRFAAKAAGALILGASLITSGCVEPAKTDERQKAATAAIHAEITQELEAYYADFSSRKWSAFSSHFWPGATITTVWQPPGEPADRVMVTTIPDFVAQAHLGPSSKSIFSEVMLSSEIRVHENLAHAWARYKARFGEPGDIAEWTGIDAFTLMKHGGRWKIVAIAFAGE